MSPKRLFRNVGCILNVLMATAKCLTYNTLSRMEVKWNITSRLWTGFDTQSFEKESTTPFKFCSFVYEEIIIMINIIWSFRTLDNLVGYLA